MEGHCLLENKIGYPYHNLGLLNLSIFFKYKKDDMVKERNMPSPLVPSKQADLTMWFTLSCKAPEWDPFGHRGKLFLD